MKTEGPLGGGRILIGVDKQSMNRDDIVPIDPFEALDYFRNVGRWQIEEAPSDEPCVLLTTYNKARKQPIRFLVTHWLVKWMMVSETCPECRQPVDINPVVWRNSGAGFICNLCADMAPGRVIVSDTKELVPWLDGKWVYPSRVVESEEKAEDRRRERLRRQVNQLDHFIEPEPENPWLFVYRGKLRGPLTVLEDADGALAMPWLEDFDVAVGLAPHDPFILGWRAIEYSSRRENESQVLADLEKIVALKPEWEEAKSFLAREHELIELFAQAKANDPNL